MRQLGKSGKMNALTSIRFIAAMYVVLFHERAMLSHAPSLIRNLVSTGNVAVSFFFILSGFVLAYTYLGKAGQFCGTLSEFWSARFARIYPVYVVSFLMFLPRVLWGEPPILVGHRIDSAIATITLTQGWTHLLYWNQPGWLISCEAFFYLVFPLVVIPIANLARRSLLWVIAGLWISDLSLPVMFDLGLLNGSSRDVILYHPVTRLPEFIIGICLG